MMHSANARNLIELFEGLKLSSYQDQNGIWTIGFGHTGHDIVKGMTITKQEAEDYLDHDLLQVDLTLARTVKVPINQNQYDALISLIFNIGEGHWETSTCLKELNQSNFLEAADAILMWNKIGPSISSGLIRRREAEKALFNKE